MSRASNAIILLDLIQAGINISAEVGQAFRQAEAEGRNITREELAEIAGENDVLFSNVIAELDDE